eukprot:UN05205
MSLFSNTIDSTQIINIQVMVHCTFQLIYLIIVNNCSCNLRKRIIKKPCKSSHTWQLTSSNMRE